MTTITVTCGKCGVVTREATKVRSIPLEDDSQVLFLLDCPKCGELIVRSTDPRNPVPIVLPWWRIIINDLRSLFKD